VLENETDLVLTRGIIKSAFEDSKDTIIWVKLQSKIKADFEQEVFEAMEDPKRVVQQMQHNIDVSFQLCKRRIAEIDRELPSDEQETEDKTQRVKRQSSLNNQG
jgi:hypothetical protein